MRFRCAVLLLALCTAACRTTSHQERASAREQERDGLAEKRRAAILDLSGTPNTSEQAYFDQEAAKHRSR
jgi:hypothetical protein